MRNLLLFLAIGLAAYGGYTYWENHRVASQAAQSSASDHQEDVPAVKTDPTTVPAPERPKGEPDASNVAVQPQISAPPMKRLAPDGVFYAVQAFSITTDAGVRGIRAGTPVKLVKDGGAMLRVSDGGQEFDARREWLTNDLDIAAKASGQQLSQQAAITEWQQKQQVLAEVNNRQNATAVAASQERAQEIAESARVAAGQRAQRVAELRAQISAEEAAKADVPTNKYGASAHQRHLNSQNEKIRLLQLELGRLGVAGAALERR